MFKRLENIWVTVCVHRQSYYLYILVVLKHIEEYLLVIDLVSMGKVSNYLIERLIFN